MSISEAPSSIALLASKTLASLDIAPKGNPTTAATFTSECFSCSYAYLTFAPFTHTEKKSYFFASSHNFFISSGITKLLHSIKAKAFAALRVEIHHLGETQKFMYFFKSFNQ